MNFKGKRICKIELSEIFLAVIVFVSGGYAYFIKEDTISDEVGYIIWAIGGLFTISTIFLRRQLQNHLDENIEIYQILEGLHDKECLERGNKIVKDCKHKLADLQRGIIELKNEEVFDIAIKRMKDVKKTVKATHLALKPDQGHKWKKESQKKYYEANKEAIKRGVKIQRIFIFDKEYILNKNYEIIDREMLEILEEQNKDGINVLLLDKDEIPEDIKQNVLAADFAIFDDSLVQTHYYNIGKIIKNSKKFKDYEEYISLLCNPSKLFRQEQDLIEYYKSIAK